MDFETDRFEGAVCPGDFIHRSIPLHDLDMPARGEIHAWYLNLSTMAGALEHALDGHQSGSARRSYTAGQLRFARRFYLRLLLGAYLGLPGKFVKINRGDRGKPVLDASAHSQELHFSMAKSEDRLLLGFSSSNQLGVDLEPISRKARNGLGVARRYFSPAEAEALALLSEEEFEPAFLRTWSCKEAVVKASGHGIANQLCRFTVETNLKRPAALLDFDGDPATDWSLAVLQPDHEFLGAIAVHENDMKICTFRLHPAGREAG